MSLFLIIKTPILRAKAAVEGVMQPGVADRTLSEIRKWPPGLPVFGQITPFPATPLYDRLLKEGRLTRPKHWLDFAPFHMAHTPKKANHR